VRTVLVTGGNGFIGRYVVEELLARGYEVHVLDTRSRVTEGDATLVFGDIRDATTVNEAVAHADGVVHLAGVLGTQETIQNPRPAAETNILGALNLLEAVAHYRTPMVNIAVGNWWMNNTYSITKSTVERFVTMMNKNRGTAVTTVRALNAYGPRQGAAHPFGPSKIRKIMPSFICRALSGQPIEIYGDGTQIMDMVYVSDVAKTLVSALEWTATNGPYEGVLEAGSGVPTTVNDIAAAVVSEVEKVTGVKVGVTHLPMRPGEDANSIVLGDPATLEPIGIDGRTFVQLHLGTMRTVAYFDTYLSTR
jgi:UDP-glucose 4-epimerase